MLYNALIVLMCFGIICIFEKPKIIDDTHED